MPTTVIFDLISALVDTINTATPADVLVFDGQGSSLDPGNFVMVGIGDPNDESSVNSASGDLEWAGLGHRSSKEHGSIRCCAVAWTGNNGDEAQQQVRENVRDIVSSIEMALRADPNLAGVVPGLNWVRYAGNWSLDQLAAPDGTAAIFRFEIAYIASLTI